MHNVAGCRKHATEALELIRGERHNNSYPTWGLLTGVGAICGKRES